MDQIERIKELVKQLHKASLAYYRDDNPIMSDKKYDDLYDELERLEKETGYVLSASPTQKVQGEVVGFLEKSQHEYPMLSANKTKEITEIQKFIGKRRAVQSWKLDGLTVVATYKNGKLVKAVTRGNGVVGEIVTHTFKHCVNLPVQLRMPIDITFRGECVVPWDTFERINEKLEISYSHPRNLAAGTLRQLNSDIAIERQLEYYVFDIIDGYDSGSLIGDYLYAQQIGMPIVEHCLVTDLESCYAAFNPENYRLPVDGLIYKYDDTQFGKSLGNTSHHPQDMMALKWADDLYETTLTNIEWQVSKTGLINPVAIFEPVNLGGAVTTRATLHNISYIEELQLGSGDKIDVYRANMVIPKVHDNHTRSNTWNFPHKCPVCGAPTEIHDNYNPSLEKTVKTLHCTGDNCKGKLLGRLETFVSKKGMNIDGLSEATLEKLVDLKWVKNLYDIYNLENHFDELKTLDGFGTKSVKKLQSSIEKSRDVELKNFIAALSIPGIGTSQSKELAKKFCTWEVFEIAGFNDYNFANLDGFGEVLNKNIHQWFESMWHTDEIQKLLELLRIKEIKDDMESSKKLNGLTFVVTGSLLYFDNREAAKERIELCGGKVSGSVSAKTSYLICNQDSNSGKCKKAKELGIEIINEEQLMTMME